MSQNEQTQQTQHSGFALKLTQAILFAVLGIAAIVLTSLFGQNITQNTFWFFPLILTVLGTVLLSLSGFLAISAYAGAKSRWLNTFSIVVCVIFCFISGGIGALLFIYGALGGMYDLKLGNSAKAPVPETVLAQASGEAVAAAPLPCAKKAHYNLCALAVALITAIAVTLETVIMLGSGFHMKIGKIQLGDSREQVIETLGAPYEGFSTEWHYEYYSKKYLKQLKKLEGSFEDVEDEGDLEDAFGDAENALKKIENMRYEYIEIDFDAEGKVVSVLYDADRSEATADEKKSVNNCVLLTRKIPADTPTDIYCSIEYSGGSFYKGIAVYGYVAPSDEGESAVTVKWSDGYGNEFSKQLRVE